MNDSRCPDLVRKQIDDGHQQGKGDGEIDWGEDDQWLKVDQFDQDQRGESAGDQEA